MPAETRERVDQYSKYSSALHTYTQYKIYNVSYTHLDVRDSKINTANE